MTIARRYVATPAGLVHVRTAGAPTASPVVLLHQTASSSAMFVDVMRRLAPHHFVFAPDSPGFGQTPSIAPASSIDELAHVLAVALEAAGVAPACVFGHHTGAALAVALAAAYPARVRRLVLWGPPLLDDAARESLAATPAIEPRIDGGHLDEIWRRVAAKDAAASLAVVHREVVLSAQALESWHVAYRAVAAFPMGDRLDRVACPTLVLTGERDSLARCAGPAFARLAAARVDVRLRTIAGAGTYVCDTHADAIAGAIAEHAS